MALRKLSADEVAALGLGPAPAPAVAEGASVPPQLQPAPAPTMSAPQQTAGQAVQDALLASGTAAAGAAMLGYDDEVMGLMTKALGGSYTQGRDNYRSWRDPVQARSPVATTVGRVAGTAATMVLPASAAIRGGQAARIAIQGGLSGGGHSTGDLMKGEVGQVAADAAVGAGTGYVAGKAAGALGQAMGAPQTLGGPGVMQAVKGAGKLGGGAGVALGMAGVDGGTATLAGGGLAAMKAAGAVGQAALAKVIQAAAAGSTTGPWVQEAINAGVPEKVVRGVISYYSSRPTEAPAPGGPPAAGVP